MPFQSDVLCAKLASGLLLVHQLTLDLDNLAKAEQHPT